MILSRVAAPAIGFLVSIANVVGAQARPTIVRLPGRTIEILGLNRWTAAMIQDSMNVYAPGESLASHACAAILKYRLHFPSTASFVIPGDTVEYAIVSLIEPQDSALVQTRMLPRDTGQSQAPWAELVVLARANEGMLMAVVRARIGARGVDQSAYDASAWRGDSSGNMRRTWAYLDAHKSAGDAAAARRLLESAPNVYDRRAAVAILSNFGNEDATWHALLGTVREARGSPRNFAGQVLRALAQTQPRTVDWEPAARDVHAVLNGANLWALDQVLDALLGTGVGPSGARPFLRNGGHAVLMYAGAAHPGFRETARRFLRVVSGRDYGDDVDRWRRWIASL